MREAEKHRRKIVEQRRVIQGLVIGDRKLNRINTRFDKEPYHKGMRVSDIFTQNSSSLFAQAHEVMKYYHNGPIVLPAKETSVIFSAVFQAVAARTLTKYCGFDVIASQSDNDPDLYFTGLKKPIEVKATSGDNWRSGLYSNRPCSYVLISGSDDYKEVFCYYVSGLQKEEWETSKVGKNGKRSYYGTTFSKEALKARTDKTRLMGHIRPLVRRDGTPYKNGGLFLEKEEVEC